MATPTKKTAAKKKPKKQHDVRGASFIRLAKRVRLISEKIPNGEASLFLALNALASAFEAEGEATRKLR